MALDKVLKIYDSDGNEVDYDIRANDVKFTDGVDLPDKLAAMQTDIDAAGQVNDIKVGNDTYTPTNKTIDLTAPFAAKQDTINDLQGIREGAAAGATAVQPGDNIPASDVFGLAPVATSGNYNDLTNKPTIPDTSGLVTQQELTDAIDNQLSNVIINNIPAGSVVIVNDLVTGGADKVLSAEMGKRLAIGYGSFAEAWARSRADNHVFCWLCDDTDNGTPFCKPIWHKGGSVFVDAAGGVFSIDALSAPNSPVFSPDINGQTVPKNTQVTITPDTGSALYYKVGSGDWNVSDGAVTLVLATAGAVTIQAYCANNADNSSTVTVSATVAGTAVPTISNAPGSTLNGSVVNRGGTVRITGDKDGTLNYSIDGVVQTPVVGDGVNDPYADVPITNGNGATVIVAYNTIDGDDSDQQTWSITMEALAPPSFSPAAGEVTAGTVVTITAATGATLKVNGTPIASNSTTVTVNSSQTITASSVDSYGESATASAVYNIAVPKLKIETNTSGVTLTLTKTDDTTLSPISLENGVTEIALDDAALGGITTFKTFAFSSNSAIVSIDFGGLTFTGNPKFGSTFTSLTKVVGIVINGSADGMFKGTAKLLEAQVSGTVTNLNEFMLGVSSSVYAKKLKVDLSGLQTAYGSGSGVNARDAFQTAWLDPDTPLDISSLDFTVVSFPERLFKNCKATKLIVGQNFVLNKQNGTNANLLDAVFTDCSITTVRITSTTPPALSGTRQPGSALLTNGDWVEKLKAVNANLTIEVPSGSKATYVADADWNTYENIITEY